MRLLVAFWFSYTVWGLGGVDIDVKSIGPFTDPDVCKWIRDVQVAKLEDLDVHDPSILWSVTPGKGFDCESNGDARRPR